MYYGYTINYESQTPIQQQYLNDDTIEILTELFKHLYSVESQSQLNRLRLFLDKLCEYNDEMYWYFGWVHEHHNLNMISTASEYYRCGSMYDNRHRRFCIYNYANILSEKGKYQECIDVLDTKYNNSNGQCITLQDEDTDVYYLRGLCYSRLKGYGSEVSLKEWTKGAELDNVKCMYQLGYFYLYGQGNHTLENKGLDYMKRGCELGDKGCAYHYARAYDIGRVVPNNGKMFLEIVEKYLDVMTLPQHSRYNAGHYYYTGEGGVEVNKIKALTIFESLDNQYNDSDAQLYIAEYYWHKNKDKSLEYYKKSASNGNYLANKFLLKNTSSKEHSEYVDQFIRVKYSNEKCLYNETPNERISVEINYLRELYNKLQASENRIKQLENQIMFYELMPPHEGGKLYNEAKNRFHENIKIISLDKL